MIKIAIILLALFIILGLLLSAVDIVFDWFDIGRTGNLRTIWFVILVNILIAVPIGTLVIGTLEKM